MTGQKTDNTTGKLTTLTAKATPYEISKAVASHILDRSEITHAWEPVGVISTFGGADSAIRAWCQDQGDAFTGGTLRAIPTSRITERDVKVETRRQLTLGAP